MGLSRSLVDLSPLRSSPAFRRLVGAQALSGLGSRMTAVAVMVQVWESTRSTAWTGAVGLASALPLVALGLFAGSLVDRVDRRRLYLLTSTGQALCSLLLAGQALLGGLPVAGVLALVAAQSCLVAVGGPAGRTFLPRLLPAEQLAAGLALQGFAFQGSLLAGPALGGLITARYGASACYLVDALTFAATLYGAFRLPAMPVDSALVRPGLRGVTDGLTFLLRTPVVRGALITDLAATVLSMPVSLFPLINAERFGDDPRTLGLLLSTLAVGGLAASLFSGAFTRLPRPGVVMLTASATWGAALALAGLAPGRWLALGLVALAGAADSIAVVSRSTIVQLHTPTELLGRVSAAEQIVGQAGPDLGNLRGGLVADATSATTALVSGGLLCLAAVALVTATTPALRPAHRLRDHHCPNPSPTE